MIPVIQLLSRRREKQPVQVHLEPEGKMPRRRQRRLRGQNNEDFLLVNIADRFKPTEEMLALRKEIAKARLTVARAYDRLFVSTNGTPNFKSLEKFQGLTRKVTLLEIQYQEMGVVAREDHRKKREEKSRAIGEQEESAAHPWPEKALRLSRINADLDKTRVKQRAESEHRKAELRKARRERREIWRQYRLTATMSVIVAKAEEAFAEDEISSGEFRGLSKALAEIQRSQHPTESAAEAFADDLLSREQYYTLRRALK